MVSGKDMCGSCGKKSVPQRGALCLACRQAVAQNADPNIQLEMPDGMPAEGVVKNLRTLPLTRYWCTDCKSCERSSPPKSRVGIAKEGTMKNGLAFLAKVVPRYRGEVRRCALCGHVDKDHWVGLYASGLSVAPSTGRFAFEPGDALIFRFVRCSQAPSDSPLVLGHEYELAFLDDGIEILEHGTLSSIETIPLHEVESVEVGGPGKSVSDAGVGGIGFSPSAFAKASVAATVMNVASTNIQIETHIRFSRRNSLGGLGWTFVTTAFEPPVVLRALDPIDRRARDLHRASGEATAQQLSGAGRSAVSSKVEELSRLAALRDQGHLSDEEFAAMKAEILSS